MEYKIFYEITSVLVIAGLISALVNLLKQPSIVAFILTGLVVGPLGYSQLGQTGMLDALGQIGITFLLFMVGLELDVKRIKELGKVALYTGLGQIVFTTITGFIICTLLGFSPISSLYISTALTFSSTIIVVKLLSEKKDLQSLYARIVVGFLIVQDFVALGILLFLGGNSAQNPFSILPGWQQAIVMLVRVLVVLLVLRWLSSQIFPKFLKSFGRSEELLLIFAVAWALGFAALCSLPIVGLSLEIGGFLAGMALANSQVHFEIGAKIRSLRDFFLIIFFIVFGTKLVLSGFAGIIWPAIILSAFVLIVQPILMLFIMGYLGYKPRTSFFASVTVAQVSEFSFILVALGNRMGHISPQILGLVTLVGLITITFSSYMILYTNFLYVRLSKILNYFDFKKGSAEKHLQNLELKNHIVLIGAHRLGSHLLNTLEKKQQPLVIVDFDPKVAEELETQNFNVICGDITDSYIQDLVNLENAKLIVSTIPDFDDNLALLDMLAVRLLKKKNRPKLIFAAQSEAEAKHLYSKEIDYVLSPHFIGGLHLAKILEDSSSLSGLKKLREGHLKMIS
jgi:Kef-type K+ transport system membrane component KefB